MFKKILEAMDDEDHRLLSKLRITKDYADSSGRKECITSDESGRPGDSHGTEAALRRRKTESPIMILCPVAFTRGSIGNGERPPPRTQHSGANELRCDRFDDYLSEKMMPLGALLLHEYTHWPALLSPVPMPRPNDDYVYGAYQVQRLRKDRAKYNADSYMWYHIEVY